MSTNEEIKAITFADLLKQHLKDSKLSAELLGKELNIDGGLVRSWVRGDRIPALNHECIPKIADLLKIPIDELKYYQEKSLLQRQSQRKIRRETKHISEELKLLASPDELTADELTEKTSVEYCRNVSSAIEGVEKVVRTAIHILENLPSPQDDNNTIFLTFQGRKSCFELFSNLNRKWLNALKEVMQKGWDICHIIRLDSDWERVIQYMSFMLEIVGDQEKYQGKYEPYCLKQKYVLEPHNGYLIIPEKEALQFFATKQKHHTDAAIYIKDKEQIKIIQNYVFRLQEEADLIFKRYKARNQRDFVEKVFEADQQPVNRTIILKRLSEITRPLAWYDPESDWAKSLKPFLEIDCPEELTSLLKMRKDRRLNLEKHLDKHRCRYIYTNSCIDNFVKKGWTSEKDYFRASTQQRLEQLENMIQLFNHNYYEMAILQDKEDDIFSKIKPSFCEVQGSHVFFMEIWSENAQGKNSSEWFLTTEPTITKAFQEYFSKLWNSIPDQNKKESQLLNYLQRHIQYLKNQL